MDTAPRRSTIADVARAAGVAPSTASVVFSGKAKVADATRERVLSAASALGYAGPDPLAASLRTGRTGIVAVVLPGPLRDTFLDPVTIATMDGLAGGLAGIDTDLLLLRDEPGRPGAAALATVPVDAVVLFGRTAATAQALETVHARRLPAVVIEGDAGGDLPRITLDDQGASATIAGHLAGLGHKDVAIITLPLAADRGRGPVTAERLAAATVDPAIRRLRGVREVFPDAVAVSAAASSIDEGMRAAQELLDASPRPTAILAQSDLLAVGALRAAAERGLDVPAQLSVTGFDGIAVDGIGAHVLTTSIQPASAKGEAAGAQLRAMLSGVPGESVRLRCRFRAGTTTASPASVSTNISKPAWARFASP